MREDGWPDEDAAFLGWCHVYWDYKRRILLEKYGIHWRSLAVMNPQVLFD